MEQESVFIKEQIGPNRREAVKESVNIKIPLYNV